MQEPAALLMDIGNVLVKVEPVLVRDSLVAQGVDPDGIDERLFLDVSGLYEQGGIDSEDFLDRICGLAGLKGREGRNIVTTAWNSIFPGDAEIAVTNHICRKAKEAGATLMLFSNTNELHIDFLIGKYPSLFGMFDAAVYSHVTRSQKPEPPMYLEALERLSLSPKDVMYFDDKPENISSGAELGLNAHVFDYRRPESFLNLFPPAWRA